VLHHDNARPHTARATQDRIQELQELLEHTPYNLDLAPNDFQLFRPLKNHIGGKCFADDEEVETDVWKWLRQESKDFFAPGFDALVMRLDKCICWWRICREINGFFFQVRISHVLRFISICDLLTDFPS
jgi:hypothetical protein